jgi:hypothetical protein
LSVLPDGSRRAPIFVALRNDLEPLGLALLYQRLSGLAGLEIEDTQKMKLRKKFRRVGITGSSCSGKNVLLLSQISDLKAGGLLQMGMFSSVDSSLRVGGCQSFKKTHAIRQD